MDVAALLPRHLLEHLSLVLGPEHHLIPAADWIELRSTVQSRIVDIVVADPAIDGDVRVETLQEIREYYPSLPIVLYTVLSASTMLGVVRLARSGIEHVETEDSDSQATVRRTGRTMAGRRHQVGTY